VKRNGPTVFFVALLATCFVGAVLLGFVKQANDRFYDFSIRSESARAPFHDIVILAIDDNTLGAHPSLPQDRQLLARALEKVCAAKPSVVGIDLLFWEPGPPGVDDALATALKKCGNTVLAAGVSDKGTDANWHIPIPQLAGAASAIGHVHSNPDEDGEVREVMLEKDASHQRYWALALECFRQIRHDSRPVLETERTLEAGGEAIPAPLTEAVEAGQIRGGRPLYVDYLFPIDRESLQKVLDGTTAVDFTGKAVLVGVTTGDGVDRKMTPVSFGVPMPGVEIHAHLLETLLHQDFLIPWRDTTRVLVQFAIVALVGVTLFQLRGVGLAIVLGALGVAVHGVPFFLLGGGQVAPAFALAAAFWIPLIAGGAFRYWMTWRGFVAADAQSRRLRRSIDWVRHEVASPLTAIQGSGQLIGRLTLDDRKRKQVSEMIGRESERIGYMITRFFDVERLSAGEIQLRRDAIDIAAVVETAVGRSRPAADRKRIQIEVSPQEPSVVEGDAELLEFAVYNLISNAVKYSPDGSVVRITARGAAGRVRIEVRDQGAGISKQDADRIFERFFRTKDAEESGKPGLGVGLSIVREITRLHSGDVTLESKVGVGSAFALDLPAREEGGEEEIKSQKSKVKNQK